MPTRHPDPTKNSLQVRSVADLEEAVRALAFHFQTDTIVIVGSQAILVGWPEAPVVMRTSPEIDAYPANARIWEARMKERATTPGEEAEASEDINAFFGQGTKFERQWGFYIDGVDENTAKLPPGWQERAVYREVEGMTGKVTVVAPSPVDLVVSKLHRLEEKDRSYIEALDRARPIDRDLVLDRMKACEPPDLTLVRAVAFVRGLPETVLASPSVQAFDPLPRCPPGSHCRFVEQDGKSVTVRVWHEDLNIYYMIDNPLGPAMIRDGKETFFLAGKQMTEEEWRRAPEVTAAQPETPAGPVPKWAR